MNRVIKFRIWNSKYKEMGEVWSVNEIAEDKLSWSEYLVVLQYTGLKDKNGKEIYEGDIVKTEYDNPSSDGTQICLIEWDNDLPGFTDGYHDGLHSDIEVIGNIYENPELVEKSDE